MRPLRRCLVVVWVVSVFAFGAAAALGSGSAGPEPATGQWKTTDYPGGFSIARGNGHTLFVKNFHLHTSGLGECSLEAPATFTALGSYPLKSIAVFGRKFEHVWGVGKYGGESIEGDASDIASVPARIKVGGKIHRGAIKLDFDSDDPSQLIFAGLSYGPKENPCLAFSQFAEHIGHR